jgi:hypothetical protein
MHHAPGFMPIIDYRYLPLPVATVTSHKFGSIDLCLLAGVGFHTWLKNLQMVWGKFWLWSLSDSKIGFNMWGASGFKPEFLFFICIKGMFIYTWSFEDQSELKSLWKSLTLKIEHIRSFYKIQSSRIYSNLPVKCMSQRANLKKIMQSFENNFFFIKGLAT